MTLLFRCVSIWQILGLDGDGVDFSQINIKVAAVQYVILLLSLSVHEASHAWTANRFGDPTAKALGRISLNPIVHIDLVGTVIFPLIQFLTPLPVIGWAKPVPVNPLNLKDPRKDDLWISFSGPASNIMLGMVFFGMAFLLLKTGILWPYGQANTVTHLILTFLAYGIFINFLLAGFNLLPIPPLDGSGVLMGILPESTAAQIEKIAPYGFLILMVLLFMGLLRYILYPIFLFLAILTKIAGIEIIFRFIG